MRLSDNRRRDLVCKEKRGKMAANHDDCQRHCVIGIMRVGRQHSETIATTKPQDGANNPWGCLTIVDAIWVYIEERGKTTTNHNDCRRQCAIDVMRVGRQISGTIRTANPQDGANNPCSCLTIVDAIWLSSDLVQPRS